MATVHVRKKNRRIVDLKTLTVKKDTNLKVGAKVKIVYFPRQPGDPISPGAEEFDTLSTENQVWSAANGAITPPDAPEVGVKYRIDMTSNNIKDQTIFFGAKCKPDQGV
ncbi:hypothetical protein OUZ56_032055 [Daphnia magna]|uniref:Uncharacterized protein n=1 Tax=Daphnia magna TaxID=35525 RepID=A0ABQ9ZW50_9CRUS|nr:hypothetical protein OUZ56_032055 [Daphnia magna]